MSASKKNRGLEAEIARSISSFWHKIEKLEWKRVYRNIFITGYTRFIFQKENDCDLMLMHMPYLVNVT
jgi:hypothetical protein